MRAAALFAVGMRHIISGDVSGRLGKASGA
jgi:hypothetical protein